MADGAGARRSLQKRAASAHRRAVRDTVKAIRAAAPVDTGQLKRSVRSTDERLAGSVLSIVIEVQPPRTPANPDNVDVAGYNEFGTRPHVIRAKRRGGALRFRTGGGIRFAASVNHPGQPARPWFYPVLKQWGRTLASAWRSAA